MKKRQVREGQIVRVVSGPLTGFRGEVKEVDERTSTARVAVQAYGRVTSMDLALEQIAPAVKREAEEDWGRKAR